MHNLEIGRELGVKYIDFHANYLPLVDHPSYLPGWVERQVAFWTPMAEQAEKYGIVLLLENMWEPDPAIINSILDRIRSPYLKACLDVGHAALYSRLPLSAWIKALGENLVYTHLHNNHGDTDVHLAFGDGVIDFPETAGYAAGAASAAAVQPGTAEPRSDQSEFALSAIVCLIFQALKTKTRPVRVAFFIAIFSC